MTDNALVEEGFDQQRPRTHLSRVLVSREAQDGDNVGKLFVFSVVFECLLRFEELHVAGAMVGVVDAYCVNCFVAKVGDNRLVVSSD